MPARTCVIINPAAGRGRGAHAMADVCEAFAAVGVTDIRVTNERGGEESVARQALDAGATTLVAVGGDGTWSNVAHAILSSGAGPDTRLALVAAGTGNDFAKTVGAPAGDAPATAQLVASGRDVAVDVGRVESRYFLNVVGFGFDIAVLEDIPRIPWLRGDAVYLYSALRQLVGYRGIDLAVASPVRQRLTMRHLMLIVANARHFGGSFRIAPGASVQDGLLDAVSILDAKAWRRAKLFAAATRGTHIGHPGVAVERANTFTVTFDRPPAYETDGEYRRAGSAAIEISCIPGSLRVVTAALAQ